MPQISLPIVDSTPSPTLGADLPVDETRGKYSFISLGCPKNLVDSERMLGLLRDEGFQLVPDPESSDFVVINTCGFIDNARQESFEAIDQMLDLKRQGRIKGVIVSGCLAERERAKLLEQRPEIDSLVGVFSRDDITQMANRLVDGLDEQRTVFRPAPIRALDDSNRLRITPPHFAYLKISEGCDRLCTFCAIPKMRGKHASKPLETILKEARQLAESGTRELIVVAQDTTYYGRDIYGESRLTELLAELEKVDGLEWIRLMYFYPMYIDDRLIDAIADSEKIVPYIDMPLQHFNAEMLRRMSRRVTPDSTRELVAKLRGRIDDLVMRTTFITGFPGETDAHFEELVEFVKEAKFERLGAFTYSLEPDTPAAKLPNHLPDEVKVERQRVLMEVQQKIAFDWSKRQVGQALEVILDKAVDKEKNVWVGRTFADAPDVDALVYVTGQPHKPLSMGQIVPTEIVSHQDYDLVGAAIGSPR
ncbi:30S ribosomal protein S12 methylthiotransferase RimO [Aureliella helgolandensis]|uniref:Ribosomal protein uS12 methylthiotransferase RimO n=1 Tax=Aureliella helgolandensis TaxID=2527968 RepID=A0A518G915_9BACT|nr:30S ribosomal protein S12 methylthiotransferase RimO [Aureliella helgolandensis]QDV25059.1 Ribosomal protein S12 methylthiotransferase RimO [Aureliella helgolandensis]